MGLGKDTVKLIKFIVALLQLLANIFGDDDDKKEISKHVTNNGKDTTIT